MEKSKSNEEIPLIDRHHPVRAIVKERYPLTKPGSSKLTVHISLDLNETPIRFKVGDSIGIYPQNDPQLVQHLITAMKATGNEKIEDPRSGACLTLWEFLSFKANLSRLNSPFLKLFYECEILHDKKNKLHHLLQQENRPLLAQYLNSHDPLDLFKEYNAIKVPLQQLCSQFGPLLPRFYSAASSQLMFKNEVHLTVGLTSFSHQGERRYGVASHFLCNLSSINETAIPIYVQPTHYFTLPSDDDAPIIMVGPGTGIAPYRAFMQERIAKGSKGKNWLFFGERNRKTDYFYEEDWTQWIAMGKLEIDLAFSRDQAEKIYVQHKMYENAKKVWSWLEEGAFFYVCGDAHRMAKDVEAMLSRIVHEQGRMSEEAAKAYVKSLRSQKRYLTDVY